MLSQYTGVPIRENKRGKAITPESGPILLMPFPRNRDVVVRQDIFLELDQKLPEVTGHQSAAVWGLGGTGCVMCQSTGWNRALMWLDEQKDTDSP